MALTTEQASNFRSQVFAEYEKAANGDDVAAIAAFYHPNGVLVQTNTSVVRGPQAIEEEYRKFFEKSANVFTDESISGTEEFVVYRANYSTTNEKHGTVKGHMMQIWKKEGEKFLIYHDEYDIEQ